MTAKILYSIAEVTAALDSVLGEKGSIQVLFNQGKIIYQTTLLARDDSFLFFDFDGIEETSLMSMIDFYSTTIFVYYSGGVRYQFLGKQAALTSMEGITVLRVPVPTSLNGVPSRKSQRFLLPEGFASISIKTPEGMTTLPVREISLAGVSLWSKSSYGMMPHSVVKNAVVSFHDGFSFTGAIEISRVNYVADGPDAMTHIISAQFLGLTDKLENTLSVKLEHYKLSEAQD